MWWASAANCSKYKPGRFFYEWKYTLGISHIRTSTFRVTSVHSYMCKGIGDRKWKSEKDSLPFMTLQEDKREKRRRVERRESAAGFPHINNSSMSFVNWGSRVDEEEVKAESLLVEESHR